MPKWIGTLEQQDAHELRYYMWQLKTGLDFANKLSPWQVPQEFDIGNIHTDCGYIVMHTEAT